MLTSQRAVREISRSSVLAEQGRLIASPNVPPQRSVGRLTLRPSFRLGRVFSSLAVCLRRKMRAAARIAIPIMVLNGVPGVALAQESTWVGTGGNDLWVNAANWSAGVPAAGGTATFGTGPPTAISMLGGVSVGALEFNAPGYTFAALTSAPSGVGKSDGMSPAPYSMVAWSGEKGAERLIGSKRASPEESPVSIPITRNADMSTSRKVDTSKDAPS
jgi:hypothetical protein